MKAETVAKFLHCPIIGSNTIIKEVSHYQDAEVHSLTYFSKAWSWLETKAGVVICRKGLATSHSGSTKILSENPRYDFGRAVEKFFMWQTNKPPKIGENVSIHPSTIINVEGMSYERGPNGQLQRIPHVGGLIIEDNVTIGALTTVQKGVLKDTVIEKGTKIGPNCNIGHGVTIGENCLITGMNFIGGSSQVGSRVYIAPHCTIKNGVVIGDDAYIGIGSLVLDNVEAGTIVVGRPAVEFEQYKHERKRLKWLLQT